MSDVVKVSGTLTKIDWRNPHIELDVNMKDGTEVQSWALEGPPPSFFRTHDINKSDIETALNKTVTAEASRARDGSHAGLLRHDAPGRKGPFSLPTELLSEGRHL